jgi:hypothetical protein
MTVERPPHPLGQMTSSELTGYRKKLERQIKRLPVEASTELRQRLGDVLAEQDERARIAARA